MKVRAIREGFFGGSLRIPGTGSAEFDIKDKSELGSWMVEIDAEGKPVDKNKGKRETKEEKEARETAEKIAKLKADLAVAKEKKDDQGIAHISGELAKLEPALT